MTRAIIYCRISEDRAGTNLGVERQERECRELAARHGFAVTNVFVDNDISAYSGKRRPAWQETCARIAGGEADALIAWHVDRLTRQPRELEDLVALIESSGTRVLTVTAGEYDLSTPAGRMCARVVGAVARHECEHRAERLSAKFREIALAGKFHGGAHRPFGFDDAGRTQRPAEVAAIRWAAAEILAGATLTDVTLRMPVPPARAERWNTTSVRYILTRPRTAGLSVHRGQIVAKGSWEPLLDLATWERLRVRLEPRFRSLPTQLLLSGIAHDPSGRPLTGQTMTNDYPRYTTHRHDPPHVGISARGLDDMVIAVVRNYGLHKPHQAPRTRDRSALVTIDRALARLATKRDSGSIDLADWVDQHTTLTRRRNDAVNALTATQIASEIDDLRNRWDAISLAQRRRLIGLTIDSIIVTPNKGKPRFDPSRVTITVHQPG